jgi:hypothetical protein
LAPINTKSTTGKSVKRPGHTATRPLP